MGVLPTLVTNPKHTTMKATMKNNLIPAKTSATAHNFDVLLEFIKNYDHSFHRTTRARPVDMNLLNSESIWKTLYGGVCKIKESTPLLKKGDHVWVSRTTEGFEKSYEQMFTDGIFIIDEVVRRGQVPVYHFINYSLL